jgi:hypothetical protein
MISMCFKALVSPWANSKWLCTFLHSCAFYGTTYEPSCAYLSTIPLVKWIESLLQTLHAYFAHSPMRHLEFTKLAKIMEMRGNKILCNMKTWWISMLSLVKKIMVKYITLLLKMAMDNSMNQQVKINFEHLYDLQIVLNLCMHFALAKICAWFNQVCSSVGHICLWLGGNCQGLQRWFI